MIWKKTPLLGMLYATKTDEFSEKFQTAFRPPPHFWTKVDFPTKVRDFATKVRGFATKVRGFAPKVRMFILAGLFYII